MAVDVIIGIGYGGIEPSRHSAYFYDDVLKVVNRLGVMNARILGDTYSPGWGDEPGAWIAASFSTYDRFLEARERILAIGGAYNQDAIAFTVGTADVAECPKPAPKTRYRDLL